MSRTNSWSTASPIDHTKFSAQPGHVRGVKTDIEERLSSILYGFATGTETEDFNALKVVPLMPWATPSTPTGTGSAATFLIFGSGVSGQTEMFGIDSGGNVLQFTAAGKTAVLGDSGWRTGDLLFSSCSTAPSGWTDVSATYDEKFIRISTGTPLGTGGTDAHTHAAGSYSGPSHTHTVPKAGWGIDTGTKDNDTLAVSTNQGNDYSAVAVANDNTSGAGGTGGISGTSASANNVPAYIQVKCYKKD